MGVYNIIEVMIMEKCNCVRHKYRNEKDKKLLINRINRLIGQMNGIKKMIEEDRYCDDVLIQLSAVDKSIKSMANLILDDHLHTCLVKDIKEGNIESLDEIVDLFRRFQ